MSDPVAKLGQVMWVDMTAPDVPRLRDFYKSVVGWEPQPVPMAGYDDYNMFAPGSDKPAVTLCHPHGHPAPIPPQWILYVPVKDLNAAIAKAEYLGGKVLHRLGPKCAMLQDPAGAVLALIEPEIQSQEPG